MELNARAIMGKKQRLAGVSLAELVITITLFGFIIMVLFNLFPSSIAALKHAQYIYEASSLAQSKVEELRRANFSSLDTAVTYPDKAGSDGMVFGIVHTPIDVSSVDASVNTSFIKGIRVTVSWNERSHAYSLSKDIYVSKLQR